MQIILEQRDADILLSRNGGKLEVNCRAFWKRGDGSLFALAEGVIVLSHAEGIASAAFRPSEPINPFR